MNLVLTGKEILHVLHSLLQNPMSDSSENHSLLEKVRRPILNSLEKEQERIDALTYQTWTDQESKKIQDLKQKNLDIKTPLKGSRRK